MKTTISDIAKQAGVSKATVSRVLNNRPEGVGAETRARIQEILQETGFQPSGFARSLVSGKSSSVGLIIPDIANPFFPLLVRGVEDTLNQAGYSLLLCNSDRDILKEKNYVNILIEKGIDGVILDSTESDCSCHLELFEKKNIPCVLLDRLINGSNQRPGVFVDNRQGARLAAAHLLARPGCVLLFINGPAELSLSNLRQAGVEDVLRAQGLPPETVQILNGDYSIESGYRLTMQQIKQAKAGSSLPFTAIFAGNDLMAVGALRALKQAGIAVPDQIEVIGFDDIELSRLVEPPLSTISQPAREMGARSAELLLQLIAGKKPRPKIWTMQTSLVLRGTTRTTTEVNI